MAFLRCCSFSLLLSSAAANLALLCTAGKHFNGAMPYLHDACTAHSIGASSCPHEIMVTGPSVCPMASGCRLPHIYIHMP